MSHQLEDGPSVHDILVENEFSPSGFLCTTCLGILKRMHRAKQELESCSKYLCQFRTTKRKSNVMNSPPSSSKVMRLGSPKVSHSDFFFRGGGGGSARVGLL